MKKGLLNSLLILLLITGCGYDPSNTKNTTVHQNLPEIKADSLQENNQRTPFRYDLKNPTRSWELPSALKEVSGNAWAGKNQLLLINDNFPALYLFSIQKEKLVLDKTIPFKNVEKSKPDIEGVALINDVVYALGSNGRLYKISTWNSSPSIKEISTFLSKENNTEGLCYDPVTNHLLIACKEASGIPGADNFTRSVYRFNPVVDEIIKEPYLKFHQKDFVNLAGKEINFYPSAIAVHPVTENIYLLSTRENKCMAVFNRAGMLLSFQFIDEDLLPQPEGICFSPEGILYISSEGKGKNPGKLFEFTGNQ